MNRLKAGFTLVELLVVMAIITILTAIAVPNIVNFLNQGQSTRALADISGVETALTEVLADAGRSKLEQLFNPAGVAAFMTANQRTQTWPPQSAEDFRRATLLYTRALTGILRAGRNVLGTSELLDPNQGALGSFNYSEVLQPDVVRKLGTSYIDLGLDPWGNLYNIYPGPWTARRVVTTPNGLGTERAPIPFRIFTLTDAQSKLPGTQSVENDQLVITYDDPDGNDTFPAGYPAPTNEIAFIWSNGANLLSSQVMYNSVVYNPGTAYDSSQDPSFWGGGDDINNWDNGNSWSRFY